MARMASSRPDAPDAPGLDAQRWSAGQVISGIVLGAATMLALQIVVAPMLALMLGLAALGWIGLVGLLVACFAVVLGLPLAWTAQRASRRLDERQSVLAFGIAGLLGFGVWFGAIMTQLLDGLGIVLPSAPLTAVVGSGAIVGLVGGAFGRARAHEPAAHPLSIVALAAVVAAAAALGVALLIRWSAGS